MLRLLLVRFGAVSANSNGSALLRRITVMLSEREAHAMWYGGKPVPRALRFWSFAYGVLTGLRRALYAARLLRRTRLPVPVVIVGNITAGGTGKTPLVIALVEALRSRGFNPGVVSRGYGGTAERIMRVNSHSEPHLVGDEARLIFDATQVPLCVGRNRAAAAQTLLKAAPVDVIIADDGLQHYALARDVEICVIDGMRRFGNSLLLPAGPLREPLRRLANVTFLVCNGGIPEPGEVLMMLQGDTLVSLADAQRQQPLAALRGRQVHAVAGIGNPTRFFAQLRAAGLDPIEHVFSDHHAYSAREIVFDDALPVVMTEKDAVKCRTFAQAQDWYLPVRAELPADFFDAVAQRLRTSA